LIISKYKEKKDLGWAMVPDTIRYLFYQDVVFQIGVPNNRPVIAMPGVLPILMPP
jgi:hypothetical protein